MTLLVGRPFTTTDSVVNIDGITAESDGTKITLASDEITLVDSGFYLCSFSVTVTPASGTRGDLTVKLQRDTGTGTFTPLNDSVCSAYWRGTAGDSTATTTYLINSSTANRKYRIVASTNNSTVTAVANASRITFVKL
jgi:hypothetical protein